MRKKQTGKLPALVQRDVAALQPTDGFNPRFKHSVNLGDLYAAMGAMKRCYEGTGRQIIVCQSTQTLAAYYPGAVHPTVNERGENVCMNKPMFDMVKPLIESQEYIHSMEEYHGQHIDIDLDVIRGKTNVNMPQGAIQNWLSLAYPDLGFDLSKPWIKLDPKKCPAKIKKQVSGKIILNFTERYRSNMMDYFFLKRYMPYLIFSGTEKEYWLFSNQWQLQIPNLEIDNFLELGYALQASRFMMCNQSQAWNLAEAMKTPRILEICTFAPNCIHGVGEDSRGYMYKEGAEYHFRVMFDKTM